VDGRYDTATRARTAMRAVENMVSQPNDGSRSAVRGREVPRRAVSECERVW
jgi:hypothetical protein